MMNSWQEWVVALLLLLCAVRIGMSICSFFHRVKENGNPCDTVVHLNLLVLDFNVFLDKASEMLNVRRGGYDCTMYGGMCGAGINNLFYTNGKIYICGNCVDTSSPFTSDTQLAKVKYDIPVFDRNYCYKESVLLR